MGERERERQGDRDIQTDRHREKDGVYSYFLASIYHIHYEQKRSCGIIILQLKNLSPSFRLSELALEYYQ